jgi:phytoene dehydrogenase-like protein
LRHVSPSVRHRRGLGYVEEFIPNLRRSILRREILTPLNLERNLYLCGTETHPGGGVSGANGRNAAATVLKDLKRRRSR